MATVNTDRAQQYVVDQQNPPPYTDAMQAQNQMQPNFTSSPYNAGYDQAQNGNIPKAYPPGPPQTQMQPNPYNAGYDQPPRPMSPNMTYGQPMGPVPMQSQTTNVVVTQPSSVVTFVQPVRPTNWVVPAVLVCFFCFWPTGICAIIAAFMAESSADNGNMEEARKTANVAKWLVIASLILPWVVIGIACIVIFA